MTCRSGNGLAPYLEAGQLEQELCLVHQLKIEMKKGAGKGAAGLVQQADGNYHEPNREDLRDVCLLQSRYKNHDFRNKKR